MRTIIFTIVFLIHLTLNASILTTPPPQESVFVINKNPFRDTQYISARRLYSPQLKDGDLFYELSDNYRRYVEDSSPFVNLYNSFVGKTIRLKKNDRVINISSLGISYINLSDDSICNGAITFTYNIGGTYYSIISITKWGKTVFDCRKDGKYFDMGFPWGSSEINKDEIGEVYDVLVNISNRMKDMFLTYFTESSYIPDEYFKIKQVKRQQTDF